MIGTATFGLFLTGTITCFVRFYRGRSGFLLDKSGGIESRPTCVGQVSCLTEMAGLASRPTMDYGWTKVSRQAPQ
jgi:hypothetical protein